MATRYTKITGTQRKSRARTPDRKPIKGREKEMVKNHAGGYSFNTTDMQRLLRFLILGVDGNTYYQTQKVLVKENAKNVAKCINADPMAVVDLVVDVSRNNRALKQDAGLFVLAMVASYRTDDPQPTKPDADAGEQAWADYEGMKAEYDAAAAIRAYALDKLSLVARTPTALYTFASFVQDMRGWGRGLRRAFGKWYNTKPIEKLAMQAWKYKQRGGFSHRDVLRLSHPMTDDMTRNKIFEYMTHPSESELTKGLPRYKNGRIKGTGTPVLDQIAAAEEVLHLQGSDSATVRKAVKLITDYRLTHEAIPSQLKQSPAIWEALLEDMPMQAMVSNLGRLSSVGIIKPLSDGSKKVINELANKEAITRSRMHPMRFLIAAKQYGSGKGRSGMTWKANEKVIDALDRAFYLSFGNVEPSGKNLLVAIDDSGSMQGGWNGFVMGIPNFTPAEAACAMGLVLYKTEPNCHMIGYADDIREWKRLSQNIRIDDLNKLVGRGGGTYTALPMHYVMEQNLDVDGIVSFTDNETWAGGGGGWGYSRRRSGKVAELLPQYANSVGHPVKFINCAVTATRCTDTDPKNLDMFEVVGFDANVPQLIGEFLAGRV